MPARCRACFVGWLLIAALDAGAAPRFEVAFQPDVRHQPATGRLVVYLIREGAHVGTTTPADGPFWYDPQPLYGIDVKDLQPGQIATVDDTATAFGPRPSALQPGRYRAQAVLDLNHHDSSWRREPGNLHSDPIDIQIKPQDQQVISIQLNRQVTSDNPNNPDATRRSQTGQSEVLEIPSKLLSDFRGVPVSLRAGIIFPANYDQARSYAAIYEVPGFGGDHLDGLHHPHRSGDRVAQELARSIFRITLDPESPNGHTLFADSDVNGRCGEALVKELIPALEAKYRLIRHPSARLLRGHSSGGWSVLWLAMRYPDVFGACWSSSPDPVDFRRFELIDIYSDDNAYLDKAGREVPSTRQGDKVTLTVRGENQQEEVLGPGNSSAQQWDSWQAVFGSRDTSGWPKPLFDAATGKIDRAEAERYKRYDISLLLRQEPQKYAPIFLQRVRLICGEADDFYLNEAVALLKAEVDRLKIDDLPEGRHGYIKLVPGLDHGSIFGSEEMRAIPQEMLDHLRRSNHISPATRPYPTIKP